MKLFGTDGIRGEVGDFITHDLVVGVSKSIVKYIYENNLNKKILIGYDTRKSAPMLMHTLCGVLVNYGIDCDIVGVVPTACISLLSKNSNYALGIMLTASHNPAHYNGLKVFNNLGLKISDKEEQELENNFNSTIEVAVNCFGVVRYREQLVDKYLDSIYKVAVNLEGVRVALDCANGANHYLAPLVYRQLRADVIPIHCNKNNEINNECGAEHIEKLQHLVQESNCDFGFAFDGDADRLRVVLKSGKVLDGDDVLYLFTRYFKDIKQFNRAIVVGTQMTNTGVIAAIKKLGIDVVRVAVGDKNIIHHLHDNELLLGGESSGHTCVYSYNPSCDALLNSIIFTKLYQFYGGVEEVLKEVDKVPQLHYKIKLKTLNTKFETGGSLKELFDNFAKEYEGKARVFIRPSGTEDVYRVLIESVSERENNRILSKIKSQFSAHNLI